MSTLTDLAVLAEMLASTTDPADRAYLSEVATELANKHVAETEAAIAKREASWVAFQAKQARLTPEATAWDRAEDDYCERGTQGCSVKHTRDSDCATW